MPRKMRMATLGCTVAMAILPATALADTAADTTSVFEAAPETEQALLTGSAGDFVASSENADVAVTLPGDPTDGVDIATSTGVEVTLELPFASTATNATRTDDATVVYDNNNGSSTVPVVHDDGSVAVNTVINDADAPTSYNYEINVGAASRLELAEDGGVVIFDGEGNVVGGVAAPWAKDANGQAVPTHFQIEGAKLIQVVSHRDADYAYPVVADPWMGFNLISKVTPVRLSAGLSYQVYPTGWGRSAPQYVHNGRGWEEAVSKGVPRRQGLYEQYTCHPWSAIARVKSSWNLDTWRPTVGFWKTVAAACNPI